MLSFTTTKTDHRARLMAGMGTALLTLPYADITIADVVTQARVSKRSFYEQFPSKDACLLALCEQLTERTLAVMSEGFIKQATWQAQLTWVVQAYLSHIQVQPALIRTLCIELMALGAPGLAVRRSIQLRFVDFLLKQVESARQQESRHQAMTPVMALAVVGGINELILNAIEQGQTERLTALAPEVIAFIKAVMAVPPPDQTNASAQV
jgi:AcrR family transcriptional regulator